MVYHRGDSPTSRWCGGTHPHPHAHRHTDQEVASRTARTSGDTHKQAERAICRCWGTPANTATIWNKSYFMSGIKAQTNIFAVAPIPDRKWYGSIVPSYLGEVRLSDFDYFDAGWGHAPCTRLKGR